MLINYVFAIYDMTLQSHLFHLYRALLWLSTKEAELMRLFYGLGEGSVQDSDLRATDVSGGSCVTNCQLGADG